MADAIITLSKPIETPGKTITEIVLREPMWDDIMTLGEPAAYARTPDGMIYTSEKDEVLRAYIERLLPPDFNKLWLVQITASDTFKLRDAVHGFFDRARMAK